MQDSSDFRFPYGLQALPSPELPPRYALSMQVIVEPDFANLSLRAATLVAHTVRAHPRAVLALPTGRTPQGMYRELVRMHERDKLDFSQSRIFNLDEYLALPSTDHRSFDYYLKSNFLSRVNVRP